MGHFVTGITVVTTLQDGPAPRDHGQRAHVGQPRAAARRGRARPAPVHHAVGPRDRPLRGQRPVGGPAGAVRLLRRRAGRARAATTSAARPGRPARPACRSSTARSRRSSARVTEVFQAGDHELFVARVDFARQRRAAPDAAALLPPPVPPDPARGDRAARGRAGARDRGRSSRGRGARRRGLTAACRPIAANGLDIAYETHGAGPPLVLLHGATSIGREDFAAQIPLFSKALPADPARRPRPRPHALGRGDGFQLRLARRRRRRVRRRARARDVPPARVLDGRDDRAPVRAPRSRSGCGRSSSSGSATQREPRASRRAGG